MADFEIGEGTRLPALTCVLEDAEGPVDLTGATGVTFQMGSLDGTAAVSATAASIVAAEDGKVRFSWGASDTTTPGLYVGNFIVTWTGGLTQWFPTDPRGLTILVSESPR